MLQNKYLVAKIDVDTAENEPSKVSEAMRREFLRRGPREPRRGEREEGEVADKKGRLAVSSI